MEINNQDDLEKARTMVIEMKANAEHPYVISVFDEMLESLSDVECEVTPSYLSIIRFGYDIFKPLGKI